MGFFDFFKKKNDTLQKKPDIHQPYYWEERSYMQIVPSSDEYVLDEGMLDRIGGIEGVTVKSFVMPTKELSGTLDIEYDQKNYEVVFFWADFTLPKMYQHQNQYFTDTEMDALKKANKALIYHIKFGEEPKKAYHLQLKLACAMVPDFMGLVDESAEKLMCPGWVKLAASSGTLPANDSIYTVQAISGKKGDVWLHTHGLARCGVTELEILDSDKDNYNNHYYVISTLAGRLLDGSDTTEPLLIGRLSNGGSIFAAPVLWNAALLKYPKNILGGIQDRKDGHNSITSIIFLTNESGEFCPVTDYNKILGENPLFFISSEETRRMSMLARERYDYLKTAFAMEETHILIKVGLPTAHGETPEHIWFELEEFTESGFKAVLTQEPYDVPDMHEGDKGEYTADDVTDWIIFNKQYGRITPETAYILN
ncbi:MAG: DUF4026 domain-containing protein [Firmicutes bacterium]|nr:DUF4026 domain-containing protein [Bacillota bacterium]